MIALSKFKYAATMMLLVCSHAFAGSAQSGIYALRSVPGTQLDFRKIYLAVDGNKVSGFFDNPFTQPAVNDPDANPTCRFFVNGDITQPEEIRLNTWYPDKQSGKIETGVPIIFKKKGGAWVAKIDGDLPNCDVSTIDTGDFLSLTSPKPWHSFAFVNKTKATLYSKPDEAMRTNGYLVRFDAVAVLGSDRGWSHVDYFGNGTDLIRWVRSTDLTER